MLKATFKKTLPSIELPQGYTIRKGRNSKREGGEYLHPDDIKAWKYLQHIRGVNILKERTNLSKLPLFSRGWYNRRYLISPLNDNSVFFAEYKGNVVGCVCVIVTDRVEFHHAMVLPEHRRKGLYKAMMIECMKYTKSLGYNHAYFGIGQDILDNFWNRVSFLEKEHQEKTKNL